MCNLGRNCAADKRMRYTDLLIAQYLKEKGLDQTLTSFLEETDCSYSDLLKQEEYGEHLSLEGIVRDRIRFGQANKTVVDKPRLKFKPWNYASKFKAVKLPPIGSMVIGAKFLDTKDDRRELLVLSSANRKTYIANVDNGLDRTDNWQVIEHNSICKFCGIITNTDICYFVTINGTLKLYDLSTSKDICSFPLGTSIVSHLKLLNPANELTGFYFIYAGLDNKLRVAVLNMHNDTTPEFEVITETKLLSKITSLEAMINTNTKKPIILATRVDYTAILVFDLTETNDLEHSFNVALNDAQFMSYSYSVLDMKLVPVLDDERTQTLVIATSHSPYMRLIVVDINDIEEKIHKRESNEVITHYDNILENIVTTVPQDAYSQPIIATNECFANILIGSNDGLYVVDLNKRDSWKFKISDEQNIKRVKAVDIDDKGSIVVTTADKEVFYCTTTL